MHNMPKIALLKKPNLRKEIRKMHRSFLLRILFHTFYQMQIYFTLIINILTQIRFSQENSVYFYHFYLLESIRLVYNLSKTVHANRVIHYLILPRIDLFF